MLSLSSGCNEQPLFIKGKPDILRYSRRLTPGFRIDCRRLDDREQQASDQHQNLQDFPRLTPELCRKKDHRHRKYQITHPRHGAVGLTHGKPEKIPCRNSALILIFHMPSPLYSQTGSLYVPSNIGSPILNSGIKVRSNNTTIIHR